MTERGRHRAPGRHARPKNHNAPLRSVIVASAAVLLTGGITAANSSEQEPPYIDSTALVIDSTVSYNVKQHTISNELVTEEAEIGRAVTAEPVEAVVIRGTGDPSDIAVAIATAEGKTGTKSGNKDYAKLYINQEFGWGEKQFGCLETLWFRESNWNHKATNPTSGAYGIPQSLPGRKMATFGDDWKTNPVTQIKWGANYIEKRYDTPCDALDFFYDRNWY